MILLMLVFSVMLVFPVFLGDASVSSVLSDASISSDASDCSVFSDSSDECFQCLE